MKKFTYLFLILFATNIILARAEVKLATIFSDNMVLQQQTLVAIWGTAIKGKKILISPSWTKKTFSTTVNDDGRWITKIPTPVAGGPYTIKISDGAILTLHNVLIGEVWICSGQSNMEVPMRGVANIVKIKNGNDYIIRARNSQLRFFTVKHQKAEKPVSDCKGVWVEANSESVAKFSAIGYLFAKQLQEILGVPVGIIGSTFSGTKIEAWMSEKLLLDEFNIPLGTSADKANSSELFNGMISSIMGFGIRGFLWYQGEGNHTSPELYARQLPAMVEEWRTGWQMDKLPFYYVQIAPYDYNDKCNSAYMRQAMADCMKIIPNSGVAILTDAGEEHNIHPMDKEIVAKRLLYWALAKTYNTAGFAYCGPIFRSMEIKGDEILVKFNYAETGLTTFGKDLTNFEIAGSDTVYIQAKATITKEGVTVSSNTVKNPIAVRYAYKDFVVGELYNYEGIPASSFETLKKTN